MVAVVWLMDGLSGFEASDRQADMSGVQRVLGNV